jgi:hypothetical protein
MRPEFDRKLKELKIKGKYIKNVRNPKWNCPYNAEYLKRYKDGTAIFETFIKKSFNWENSPEGFDFWDQISMC